MTVVCRGSLIGVQKCPDGVKLEALEEAPPVDAPPVDAPPLGGSAARGSQCGVLHQTRSRLALSGPVKDTSVAPADD